LSAPASARRWHGGILLIACLLICDAAFAEEAETITVNVLFCLGADSDSDGWTDCDLDCDDNDATVFPGAPELCDGSDNQCADDPGHGATDEGCDDDLDGYCDDAMTTLGTPPVCPNGGGDCNDDPGGGAAVNPSATEVCNGVDDDCDSLVDEDENGEDSDGDGYHNLCDNCPQAYNPDQTDDDGDGYGVPCDCNDDPGTGMNTYPGAPEINDGLDNQCPGEYGYGVADEMTGDCGFHNPSDSSEYSCDPLQEGADLYEQARWSEPNLTGACVIVTTVDTLWIDTETPDGGEAFYYLTRPISPHAGSWGQSLLPPLAERSVTCSP
jgi:hypothetical protein